MHSSFWTSGQRVRVPAFSSVIAIMLFALSVQLAQAETLSLTCTETRIVIASTTPQYCNGDCQQLRLIVDTDGKRVRVGDADWVSANVDDYEGDYQVTWSNPTGSFGLGIFAEDQDGVAGMLDIALAPTASGATSERMECTR